MSLRQLARLALATLLAQSVLAAPESIQVGVLLPLSGDLAPFGGKIREGIELAQDTYSHNLQLVYEDSSSKRQALAGFHKLVAFDKIKVLIGPFGPDQTLVIAPKARQHQIVVLALSLCDPRFKQLEHVFCLYPSQEAQTVPLLNYFEENKLLENARIGLLFEELDAALPYREMLSQFAARTNSTIVEYLTFQGGRDDFRSAIVRMRAKNINLFVVGAGNPADALMALRQAEELGFRPETRWYFSELDAELFMKNQDLLEGVYTSSIPELNRSFIEAFRLKYGHAPDLYHAIGYDALASLGGSLASQQYSMTSLTESLINNTHRDSATVRFKFDRDRAVAPALRVGRIRDGRWTAVESH